MSEIMGSDPSILSLYDNIRYIKIEIFSEMYYAKHKNVTEINACQQAILKMS